jgi:hypothetical protein
VFSFLEKRHELKMSERNCKGKHFNLRRLNDVRHYVERKFKVYSLRGQIVLLGIFKSIRLRWAGDVHGKYNEFIYILVWNRNEIRKLRWIPGR